MNKSEQINELAAALVAAQKSFKALAKSAKGNYGDYSTFDDILASCRDALHANGLALVQHPTDSEPNTLALETMIVHTSGQWMSAVMPMPVEKATPQKYGSALTYARRYGAQAMLGLSGLEDDDAQSVEPQPKAKQNGTKPQDAGPIEFVNASTLKALNTAGRGYYAEMWDEQRAILVAAVTKHRAPADEPITSSKDLTMAEAKKLIDGINAKADGGA